MVWNKPRKESVPVKATELDFRFNKSLPNKCRATPDQFPPWRDINNYDIQHLREELCDLCRVVKPGLLKHHFDCLLCINFFVTQDKLAISIIERTTSLDLLQGMAYAASPEAYDRMYAEFCASVPQAVRTYFDRNWHGIRQEWVACHKRGHGNYMTDTNNRLESINQKLKAVVKRYSSMPVFFRDLMEPRHPCLQNPSLHRYHHECWNAGDQKGTA